MTKTTTLVAASIVLLLFAAEAEAGSGLVLAPGDSAPEVRGDTPGGARKLVDYQSTELSLVNFWATWCEPCKAEMPALEQLQKENAGRLQVIGVLYDAATDGDVESFLESIGVSYTVIRPLDWVIDRWGGVGSLPTTYLVDGSGVIRRRYVGATAPQVEGLIADVRNMLAGKPMEPLVMPEESNAVTIRDRPEGGSQP